MKGTVKTRRRAGRLALALTGWLALAAAALLLLDGRTVRFYRNGEEEMSIEYGTAYEEPGVYAVTTGRLFGEGKRQLPVEVAGTVDSTKLGTHVLRYTASWLFSDYSIERRVNVVDTTPPVIELRHTEGYAPDWLTGYEEEGYSAHDAADGDLTDRVQREKREDRVLYTVSDSAGNTARAERILPAMSYQAPRIVLEGEADTVMQAGFWYTDPGARVEDGLGTDLNAQLVTEGLVIPWVTGDYEIRYSVTNRQGETVSAVRNVHVVPVSMPQQVTPAEKTIYLTFDDGPGPYTSTLLDVLDRYGVKATFFVTAQAPQYYDQIGRAFRAGHSIGVHSTSHDYDSIYSSEYAFFEDFSNMEEIIKAQTGEYTRLFRFPGGSSNTVSSFNPGIMSRLTRAMNNMGYQYYDWNVSSGDAGGTTQTAQIIKNIKEGCAQQRASVVLQHDIKAYSVSAVESVIQWGLENGYSFRPLQLDSPAAHHGVNN